jgi:hypothetical protein
MASLRIVRQRVGLELDKVPGGRLLAISQLEELARRVDGYSCSDLTPYRASPAVH